MNTNTNTNTVITRRTLLVLLGGLAGVACSPAASPTSAPAPAATSVLPAAAPTAGQPSKPTAAPQSTLEVGKETAEIVVGLQGGGLSRDPAKTTAIEDWAVIQSIYNGLLRYKPGSGDLEPDLAESWDVSQDSRINTFHLRKGVEFHAGFGEVTSADVKFTFERIEDPALASVNKGFCPWSTA
jgi:ABC-type transport system substrate-binding protein